MPTVISINSTEDASTIAATAYREAFIQPVLSGAGLTLIELTNIDANAVKAQASVNDPNVVYVTGVSHGTSDSFTGSDGAPIFALSDRNCAWAQGKVIHFLSCNTATCLGPDLVKPSRGGAAAFLGYTALFTWPSGTAAGSAALFFDCDAEIDRVLASKGSTGQALKQTLSKYDGHINALKATGDPQDARIAAMLSLNRNALRGPDGTNEYGNPAATIM
jgi:hypothetical protein